MIARLPPFTHEGLLPVGDFVLTFDELFESALVLGPDNTADAWDARWRRTLAENLAIMVGHLCQVGLTDVFIDGSFVENKPRPNDIDGYFLCDRDFFYDGELETKLQKLDPAWTWDAERRHAAPGSTKQQLPMWHKYRVELFPHVGQWTGIVDQFGHELTFPSAFRLTRDFKPKGILKIGGLP